MLRKVLAMGLICLAQALFLTGCLSNTGSGSTISQAQIDNQNISSFLARYTSEAEAGDSVKSFNLAILGLTGIPNASMQSAFNQEYEWVAPSRFSGFSNTRLGIEWLGKAVSQNHADAKAVYAEILFQGKDKTKYAKANKMLQEAIAQGSTRAKAFNGVLYTVGLNGVKQDLKKAKQIFEEVPQESYSKYGLAYMCYYGKGVSKDVLKARDLANEAAQDYIYEAMILLAHMYNDDKGIEKQPYYAAKWAKDGYQTAERRGFVDLSALELATSVLLQNSQLDSQFGSFFKTQVKAAINVEGDKALKAKIFSEFGEIAVQNRLGLSPSDVIFYKKQAASLGDKQAEKFVAKYEKEEKARIAKAKAERKAKLAKAEAERKAKLAKEEKERKAQQAKLQRELNSNLAKAKKGDTNAQIYLLDYYYNVDPMKAVEYANKLAAKNNPYGFIALATMHLEGKNLPKNPQLALEYMNRAANLGEPNAVKFMNQYYAEVQRQQEQQQQQQLEAQSWQEFNDRINAMADTLNKTAESYRRTAESYYRAAESVRATNNNMVNSYNNGGYWNRNKVVTNCYRMGNRTVQCVTK